MMDSRHGSQAERALAISLALIAGYVDAYGFVIGGNTTRTGSVAGHGNVGTAMPIQRSFAGRALGVCDAEVHARDRDRTVAGGHPA